MIKVTHKGDFRNLERFLQKAKRLRTYQILRRYGEIGVAFLASATPRRTGLTASSWDYTISSGFGGYSISWFNKNVNNGVPIALLIQYGHGTGTGGYVQPTDYINPAMREVFDKMAEEIWKEVTRL